MTNFSYTLKAVRSCAGKLICPCQRAISSRCPILVHVQGNGFITVIFHIFYIAFLRYCKHNVRSFIEDDICHVTRLADSFQQCFPVKEFEILNDFSIQKLCFGCSVRRMILQFDIAYFYSMNG